MKNKLTIISSLLLVAGCLVIPTSCRKNILRQEPTTELGANAFWKTEQDATYALMGAYASIRPLFDRDYYYDGQGEYVRARGTSTTAGNLRLGDA